MSGRGCQLLVAQTLFILATLQGFIQSAATSPPLSFAEYVARFGKVYEGSEYLERKELFEKRLVEILDHNSHHDSSWIANVTSRTDAKPITSIPRLRRKVDSGLADNTSSGSEGSLPATVDWRNRQPSVLTDLFDQSPCGDCWAIHSVKALESHLAIATGELLKLSIQRAADCSSDGNSRHDCNYGGYPEDVFSHAAQHGIPLHDDYPRLGRGAPCNLDVKPAAGVQGSVKPTSNNAKALMSAVAWHGPVSVGVDSSSWDNYQSGIFDGSDKTSSALDHEVLLVGYGEEGGIKFWIVQNSWGSNWGERGFIRLRRHTRWEPCVKDKYDPRFKNCGESGILADTTYPKGVFRHRHQRRLSTHERPSILI